MIKFSRSLCLALTLVACSSAFGQKAWSGTVSGTWTALTHQPTVSVTLPILLQDGSVMVQQLNTNHWWKFKPDSTGSYINGTWSALPDMRSDYGPHNFASAVLADGRVVVIGGEYNFSSQVWTNLGAIYDPVENEWTNFDAPSGWNFVGDAQCCVLPNGKLMLADPKEFQAAVFDPVTNIWSSVGLTGKEPTFAGEGWTLLRDGTVLTIDTLDAPAAEKYIPWDDDWVPAGETPTAITDGFDIGPAVLRFNGTVFATGANGQNAVYTPPATPTDPGTWAAAPNFPIGFGADDAPACLLTGGNVLVAAENLEFDAPTQFFEYDGGSLVPVANPPTAATLSCSVYTMLMLPSGQVMLCDEGQDVEIYTSPIGPQSAWRPTLTTSPVEVAKGADYSITGTQFNGLSQTNAYGDDNSNASNYPIVRIRNNTTGHIFYCRTHDPSTMGVATGTTSVSAQFTVPSGVESGNSTITVVANGIPTLATKAIFVGPPIISILSPNNTDAGSAAFTLTINGSGFRTGAIVEWIDAGDVETDITPNTVGPTQITLTVPASLVTTHGLAELKVANDSTFVSASSTFTINDRAPVANAGVDQSIEATGPTTSFTLDGTASSDPDGDSLTYTWYDSSNTQVGTGSTLQLSRGVGVHTFKLTVSDGTMSNDDTVQVTITDTTAPVFATLPDITVADSGNPAGTAVTYGPFSATDLVDGVVAGTAVPASGSLFPPGQSTVNVSATDAAGNTGYASFHVTVGYSWSGFLSPLPKQQFKKGSAVPIKFRLTGASAGITNLVATGYWATVSGGVVGTDHTIGTFKYDTATGNYVLNWKTTGLAKGTYQIKVIFGDGSVHTVQIVLK